MADLTEVYSALQKADAAGDTAAAKQLADYIRAQPNPLDDLPPPGANPLDSLPPPARSPIPFSFSMSDFLRKIALGGRAVGEGVVGTFAAPHDINVLLMNAERSGINKLFGTNLHPEPTFMQGFSQALTDSGAYTPETKGEQYGTAITRGVAGALTGAGVLGGVSPSIATTPNVIRTALAGATGAGSSELARQSGANPYWQFVSGMIGGLAPGGIEGTVRLGARLAGNLTRPLTLSGQEQIAANTLGRQATDPQTAAANLDVATEIVPGSARTTGEASQDVGLLALQKAIQNRNPAAFGQRISEQNAARQAELTALGGSPSDIAAARAAREAATTPMREQAFRAAGQADTAPVHDTIDALLQSPAGQRQTVASTLNWAKEQIGATTDPAALYEIRKDLQLAQMGKLQPTSPNAPNASTLAQARGQLGQVVGSLDDAIEGAAPGFKAYLQTFKDLSRPIDQMKTIQELTRRAQSFSLDISTGQNFLGAGSFDRTLDSILAKSGSKLTSDQLQRLEALRTDLGNAQAVNSPLIRAPGSDTFQNLSQAQALGRATLALHPLGSVMTNPLSWLYKSGANSVNDILTRAMLDPRFAAALLNRTGPPPVSAFSGTPAYATGTLGASPAFQQ